MKLLLFILLCNLQASAQTRKPSTFTTTYGKVYDLYYDSTRHRVYYLRNNGKKMYLRVRNVNNVVTLNPKK